MKYCKSCLVQVEGNYSQCPLCQNGLTGDGEKDIFPSIQELRKQSYLYKIQLFFFISIMLTSLVIDFGMDIAGKFHWSFIVVIWVIGSQLWLKGLIQRHNNPSRVMAHCEFFLVLLSVLTFVIIGYIDIYMEWILPGMAVVVQILHFVYMMMDNEHNAMPYLLGVDVICVLFAIGYILLFIGNSQILWMITPLVGVISIIGAIIFKGRRVTSELQMRFHV